MIRGTHMPDSAQKEAMKWCALTRLRLAFLSILALSIAFSAAAQSNTQQTQASTDPAASQTDKNPKETKKQQPEEPERLFARACGLDFDKASSNSFIFSLAGGWRPYIQARPPETEDDQSLYTVRFDDSARHYVHSFTSSGDFDIYQDDCFRESGKLEFFHFELRTSWGWGYEELRKYNPAGKNLETSTRFFNTEDEKTIAQPGNAKEAAAAMKPSIHMDFNSMPFIAIYNEP
ncbi:MAG TPA: hypothetical protein VKT33_00805 [Candidatus Angelobacter sp.]|nr:hypothetical protein [Candidatus Angelobacter sp.]